MRRQQKTEKGTEKQTNKIDTEGETATDRNHNLTSIICFLLSFIFIIFNFHFILFYYYYCTQLTCKK